MLVCSSPQLIAAYHVLHRLSEPRHPPYALNCFKKIKIFAQVSKYLHLDKITRYYNLYSQYVKELGAMCEFANVQICECFVDVLISNQRPCANI